MVNERPRHYAGIPLFQGNMTRSVTLSASPDMPRATQIPTGLGKGGVGLGKAKTLKRHKKIPRDTIQGVTKGDIRRLARRGGIKRISAPVYDDIRAVLKGRLELLLKHIVALLDHSGRQTVAVTDVIYTLNRLGRPIYGFDPTFDGRQR